MKIQQNMVIDQGKMLEVDDLILKGKSNLEISEILKIHITYVSTYRTALGKSLRNKWGRELVIGVIALYPDHDIDTLEYVLGADRDVIYGIAAYYKLSKSKSKS